MGVFPEHRMSFVTLGCADRAALTAFYEDVIGLKNVGPDGMTIFDMGGFLFGLWENDKLADDAGIALGDNTGFKGAALAYNARSVEEVDAMFAALAEKGVEITTAPHKAFWGGYSGYFADPEGNAWEIAYNPFMALDDAGRVVLPKKEDA